MLKRIRESMELGHTFERIARDMGHTKNTILGLLHRNKEDGDETDRRERAFRQKFSNRTNMITLPKLEAKPIYLWKATPPSKKHELLMASGKPGTCLWLEGDATLRKFCGTPCKGSWCDKHRKEVFIPWKPSANQVSSISPLRAHRQSR